MIPSTEFVIETWGLSKTFGEVQAFRGVDLRVPRHSIFGFLGPNGAGKTTLMKILLGLSHPTSGSGTIFGSDIVRDGVAIRERSAFFRRSLLRSSFCPIRMTWISFWVLDSKLRSRRINSNCCPTRDWASSMIKIVFWLCFQMLIKYMFSDSICAYLLRRGGMPNSLQMAFKNWNSEGKIGIGK